MLVHYETQGLTQHCEGMEINSNVDGIKNTFTIADIVDLIDVNENKRRTILQAVKDFENVIRIQPRTKNLEVVDHRVISGMESNYMKVRNGAHECKIKMLKSGGSKRLVVTVSHTERRKYNKRSLDV